MSDFFDNLGKTVNDTAKKAIKVSNELVEVAGINLNIRLEQNKRGGYYREIGRIMYDAYKKDPSSAGGDIINLCKSVEEAEATIAELKKKAAALRKHRVCDSCGSKVSGSMNYCPACGSKVETCECDCGCEE